MAIRAAVHHVVALLVVVVRVVVPAGAVVGIDG